MGSNDPLENPLFIQKREYHAIKDENCTDQHRPENRHRTENCTGPTPHQTDTAPADTDTEPARKLH